MTRLVDFSLADGGSVLVEVEEPADGPVLRGGRVGPVIDEAGRTFEEALGRLGPATRAVLTQLRDMTESPDEIEVEFGVRLSAEAGVIIARGAGEANFRVAVKWSRAPSGGG